MPPIVRLFNWRRDRQAVLQFQYETYERNFPGFRVDGAFLRDYERQLREAARHPAERLWVLEDDGQVCGFVWAALIATMLEPCVGYIKSVYVAPNWRGRGCGEQLIATAEQWFADEGIPKATLDASVGNQAALGLYERLGYRVTRLRMEKPCG